jgi:hypothetical protein
LRSGIVIANRRSVRSFRGSGLVHILVPLVPRIAVDLLRQEVPIPAARVRPQALAGSHLGLISSTGRLAQRAALPRNLCRSIEDREDRWRLIEVHPHRRILHWRQHIAARSHRVAILRSRAQLKVGQPLQQRQASCEHAIRIYRQRIQRQRAVRRQPRNAAILKLHLSLAIGSRGDPHTG